MHQKELVMKHLLSREFREIRNKSDTHEEWIRELMENMNTKKNQKVKEMFSGCTAQKDDSATLAMDWTPSIVFLRLLALRPMI